VRTETVQVFIAFDGSRFAVENECRAYELEWLPLLFVGLTRDNMDAVMLGQNPDLADAFERLGRQLAVKRRATGNLKRHRRQNGNGETP
jgi:hypothetical protein